MKTTIKEEWAIGTWAQRDELTYVSRDQMINGRSACNCISSSDSPTNIEFDDSTGVVYLQYESGNAPIFKKTITEA